MNMKVLVAGGLVVLGAIGLGLWLGPSTPAPAPGARPTAAPAGVAPAPAARLPAALPPADMQPAPWAAAPGVPAGNGAATPPAVAGTAPLPIDPALRQQLDKIQADLAKSMREGGKPDPRQVDAALLAMRRAAGSPNVGGINIDAVRSNLAVAGQIQAIAMEIERESKKGGASDAKKMRAYAEQLQALQSQLRIDVSAPVADGAGK